ncbi:filamentous hemagglutinin N-terminal domain-containing protein [Ralstonia soli]|uniref:Filamentous hemagglutinin N-terminal domain-containing protein n=1 Tax=Ralstonia soli TaxID=2953896 RepID=A0ABT1AFY1_9RALS|nr:filamentous hemagglutinin N-terminal domain-containing protein [Ralstonia soli]MCO5397285.1 filamentous hemagglutinin N-terminal domain-containing protein [Ralstonia soli]
MTQTPTPVRSIALAALLMASAQATHAVGTGTITDGTGSISRNGNTTTVTQTSNKLIVNWDSMNVGANDTLTFAQKNASAAVLNRINSADPTTILGTLNANGRVFIVNPNGVLIGNGARVNVGSLVASSLNISDEDFKADRLRFTGGGQGDVTNNGFVIANESVALIGAKNVTNGGRITSFNGDVALAAGDAIYLTFADSHLQVGLDKASLEALVVNRGILTTRDGDITLAAWARDALARTAVNNTGVIEAAKLNLTQRACLTCAPTRGNVWLESIGNGGDINSSGSLFAGGNLGAHTGSNINFTNLRVMGGAVASAGQKVNFLRSRGGTQSNQIVGDLEIAARTGGTVDSTQALNIQAFAETGELRFGDIFTPGNLSIWGDTITFTGQTTIGRDLNVLGTNVIATNGSYNAPLLDVRGNTTIDGFDNVLLSGRLFSNTTNITAHNGQLMVGALTTYGDTYLRGAQGITIAGRGETGNLTLETAGNVDNWFGLQVFGDLTYKLAPTSLVFAGAKPDVVYGQVIGLPRR